MDLDQLLTIMTKQGASDLHLKPTRPPLLRLNGRLLPLKTDPLKIGEIQAMVEKILTPAQQRKLEEMMSVDLGYGVPGVARFRGNIFVQRGNLAACFRRIPFEIQPVENLNLPQVLLDFCTLPMGLVLVTGPTGSGKSTTLAALIKHISNTRPVHVITIEDPIEFLFSDAVASISQRELGTDTIGFSEALRNAMRQDPDVIMVGEMRDPVTMSTVITAAETGHLVFSTLHTNSATQTIDRILDSLRSRFSTSFIDTTPLRTRASWERICICWSGGAAGRGSTWSERGRRVETATAARVVATTREGKEFAIVDRDVLPRSRQHAVLTTPPYPIEDSRVAANLRWYLANSRHRAAVAAGGDDGKTVFLSIHADSLHPTHRGVMMYIPGTSLTQGEYGKTGAVYEARKEVREKPRVSYSWKERTRSEGLSRELAKQLLQSFRRQGIRIHDDKPIRDRIIRCRRCRPWVPAVVRYNAVPAKLLLEVCNLNNSENRKLLQTRAFRQQVAVAVVDGILEYYGQAALEAPPALAAAR